MAVRGGFLCARTIYRERGRTTKPPLLLFHRCARTRESISILPGNLTSVKSHDINNSPSPSQPASGRVPPFFFSSFFYTLRGFRRRTRCKCFLMHTIVFFFLFISTWHFPYYSFTRGKCFESVCRFRTSPTNNPDFAVSNSTRSGKADTIERNAFDSANRIRDVYKNHHPPPYR